MLFLAEQKLWCNSVERARAHFAPLTFSLSVSHRELLWEEPWADGAGRLWAVFPRWEDFNWVGWFWDALCGMESGEEVYRVRAGFYKHRKLHLFYFFNLYKEISLIGQSETLKQHYSFGFFCDCVQPLCLSLLRLSVWVKLAYCQGPFPFTKLDKTLFLLFELSF